MLEISWLAFYMLLHVALSLGLLPLQAWSRRVSSQHAAVLIWVWSSAGISLVVLPLLLLQPWALDTQVVPWFHQGMTQLLPASTATLPEQPMPPQLPPEQAVTAVRQVYWPLASQVLYLLSPSFWCWLIVPLVALLKLLGLARSYLAVRRLRATAQPLGGADIGIACYHTNSDTNSHIAAGHVAVAQHDQINSAMLIGWRRPLILLPRSYLVTLHPRQLALIVRHELCHLAHGDLKAYTLQQLLSCLFWWSSGWRLVCQELMRWREVRCDLAVAASDEIALDYAQTLLDCARLPTQLERSELTFTQRWLQPSLLALRINAVLQPNAEPRRLAYWPLGGCVVLVVFSCLWLAHHWQLAQLPARHAQVRLSDLPALSQLLAAVRQGDRAAVGELLDAGAPLNIAMPGQGSALMVAVRQGDSAMVELLLSRGADVSISSRGDGNALIIAAQRGDLTLAKRLLAAGADVNAAVLADETPLINAAANNDMAMVQLLLAHGADVNLQVQTPVADGPELRSPLNRASSPELIQLLRERGAR